MDRKKVITAVFATVSTLVAGAVAMDVIPPGKVSLFIVYALGVIGTTLLPAVTGQAVAPATLAASAGEVASRNPPLSKVGS